MRRATAAAIAALIAVMVISTVSFASTTSASANTPKRGGSLTVLVNSGEWPTLDPAGPGAQPGADVSEFGPVYGQLFMAGQNDSVVAGEAQSWKMSNGNKTVNIYLRKGMKFSDGTPFNAAAVAASINRDLEPSTACSCQSLFADVTSVTAVGQLDVRIQLSTAFAAIISVFIDYAPNYTVDPTALAKMGETAYGQDPTAAGPFIVVSNEASAKLVLKRNPLYFDPSQPYLNSLTVIATTSDQSDIDAIETGSAQMTSVATPALFNQAAHTAGLKTAKSLATTFSFIRLNTFKPPFNNPIAREAVAYATDAASLVKNLYDNAYTVTQGFDAPGMLFYDAKVKGYHAYDLAKAKQLVSQIPGGLAVTIQTTSNTPSMIQETEAIAAQWAAAGITVTEQTNTLETTIDNLEDGNWQTFDAAWACGIDPETCLPLNVASNGEFTGDKDPTLDGLIAKAAALVNPAARTKLYAEIFSRIDTEDYMIPMYATGQLFVMRSNVEGFVQYPAQLGYEDFQTLWIK